MLRDVLDALVDVLTTEIGSELASDGIDAQISPRTVLDPSESPCIDIIYVGRERESTGYGEIAGAHVLTVRVRMSAADDESVQDVLIDMVDDDHELCVAAALESDPTLDGWATSVWVDPEGFSGVLNLSTDTKQMIGCTWRVLVEQAHS